MSGAHMIFDLVEVALGYKPLEGTDDKNTDHDHPDHAAAQTILIHALDTLRDLAAEIVALSSVRIVVFLTLQVINRENSTGHRSIQPIPLYTTDTSASRPPATQRHHGLHALQKSLISRSHQHRCEPAQTQDSIFFRLGELSPISL
jgi:hypothetical protein